VTFVSVPIHANLLILTASGNVVRQWVDDSGEDIIWDGTNQSGNAVASGVYLWFVEGTDVSGKLVVIR
jgi:predicted membrane-bound dolichyl-phosphate-mannose-protein mannosyltransferase